MGGSPGTGGGGEVVPDPILEREPAISHDCTEERPMTSEIGATNAKLEGLASFGGEFFVTSIEETFDIAKVGLDGVTGEALTIVSQPYVTRSSIVTSDDTSVVTVWSEGNSLNFARVDGDLQLAANPSEIPEAADTSVNPSALLPTSTGFALLYGAGDGVTTDLYFLQLDPDGQAIGAPVLLAALGEQYGASASMTPTGDDGFAVAFTTGSFADGYSVMFTLIDADGSARFEPKRISQAPGGGLQSSFSYYPRRNIVKVGDSYWVTFSEDVIDYDTSHGSAIVRLAVVDAEGGANLHALQAPVDQIENRFPSFVEVDGAVGIVWTSGSIIWVCGGCVTDYDLHFVLIDQTALVPASDVVTHVHQNNGINAPVVAVDGQDMLTGGNLDFHALTMPATGAMRCVASP